MSYLNVLSDVPTQYYVFMCAIAMVTGFAADWTLGKWGFGIFMNTGVFFAGVLAAYVTAGAFGFYQWEEPLPVVIFGIAGGMGLFTVLSVFKNQLLD